MITQTNPTVFAMIGLTLIMLLYVWTTLSETAPAGIDMKDYERKHFIAEILGSSHPAMNGILIGVLCLFLCWTVNYFNWLRVGEFPTTPLSSSPQSRLNRPSTPADIMHHSEATGFNSGLAYFTPILVSVSAAGIMVWNSIGD